MNTMRRDGNHKIKNQGDNLELKNKINEMKIVIASVAEFIQQKTEPVMQKTEPLKLSSQRKIKKKN